MHPLVMLLSFSSVASMAGWRYVYPVLPAKLGGFAGHSFAHQAKPPMQLMRFRQKGETRKQRFFRRENRPL
jgi:hypothetical protein